MGSDDNFCLTLHRMLRNSLRLTKAVVALSGASFLALHELVDHECEDLQNGPVYA